MIFGLDGKFIQCRNRFTRSAPTILSDLISNPFHLYRISFGHFARLNNKTANLLSEYGK